MEVPPDPNQKADSPPPLVRRSVFNYRPTPLPATPQPDIPSPATEPAAKPKKARIDPIAAALLGIAVVTLAGIFLSVFSSHKPPKLENASLPWPPHLQPQAANQPYPQPSQMQLFATHQAEGHDFINRGTYRVVCYDGSNQELRRGAGFAISDRFLVTCLSVLQGAEVITVVPPHSPDLPAFQITTAIARDEVHDLVILELPIEHPATAPFALECLSLPFEGDKVYLLTQPDSHSSSLSEGSITGYRKSPSQLHHLLFQADSAPGAAGGALVNGRGAVVGILEKAGLEKQTIHRAIPVAALWEILAHPPEPVAVQALLGR